MFSQDFFLAIILQDTDSFWNPNAFETDSDLPAGWMRVQDTSGTYYWHIPTGTTQWEPCTSHLFFCVWQCFAVRSLGWVEMTEEELAPGRSSVAVNNCIRQLSYHKNNLHDPMSGGWGEGKDLLLQLEDETLKLVEPQSQALLHAQPIVSIRVWGVGRDSGRWELGLGS
uniref:Amyloid beta precursor protein binding family B member 1 n=1 Tax=Ursus americanus TaxID=9643 RepID=A0A452SJW5_URSAM